MTSGHQLRTIVTVFLTLLVIVACSDEDSGYSEKSKQTRPATKSQKPSKSTSTRPDVTQSDTQEATDGDATDEEEFAGVEEAEVDDVQIPDFSAYVDVKKKKRAFFEYLYPYVKEINDEVYARRLKLISLSEKSDSQISDEEKEWIAMVADMYLRNPEIESYQQMATKLLDYVDVVAPSLAMAQAANESGWGTSRFAVDANNFFGQWCFKQGCGLVPDDRNDGAAHEVRKFHSPEGSVRSYIRNINTHRAYRELREIRSDVREDGRTPTGMDLSKALTRYSQRREAYVKELRSMIRVNKLVEYDKKYWGEVDEEDFIE